MSESYKSFDNISRAPENESLYLNKSLNAISSKYLCVTIGDNKCSTKNLPEHNSQGQTYGEYTKKRDKHKRYSAIVYIFCEFEDISCMYCFFGISFLCRYKSIEVEIIN